MSGLAGLLILIALAILLGWLSAQALRARHRLVKWGGTGLAGLAAAALALVSVVAAVGLFRMEARSAPVPALTVAGSPAQILRGTAIADSFCSGCHSATGTLTGGVDLGEDFPAPVGSFVSANLTPAGALRGWSDGEIFRAIRNGIDADGRWLVVMSYTNAGKLSDEDIEALIAYIRNLPADGAPTPEPPDHLNMLGTVMLGAGMLPTGNPVIAGAVTAPPKSPTAAYGAYILSYQDCRNCHGADLAGGVEGQLAPIGPSLDIVRQWTLTEFITTMRTGVDPDGHALGKLMPWRPIGRMDDETLQAVYEYLTHRLGGQNTVTN